MTDDLLEEYLKEHSLTKERVLELVDEYSIYTFYIGEELELNTSYSSPLRKEDKRPSFALFLCKDDKIRYKDHAVRSGDVFDFVGTLLNLNYQETLQQIDTDLELGISEKKVSRAVKRPIESIRIKERLDIEITSKPFTKAELDYWMQFNIDLAILNRHQVYSVKFIHYIKPSGKTVVSPQSMCFAYRVRKYYKLYFPNTENRFQNNYLSHFIEGFNELKYQSDTLIITKSKKDVMCLDSLGYEAVSPRGESILMPNEYFTHFSTRYKRILVLFDNDGKHNAESYPYPKIFIPIESGCKDISDYVKKYGVERAKELLNKLI